MELPKRVQDFASEHASWFSGAWFGASALLLVAPLGAMTLLIAALEALASEPIIAYLWLFLTSTLLPPVAAFGMGALVGPWILRLPHGSRSRAAGWGAAAALGALVLWVLLLEGLPYLVSGAAQASGGGGDVPGAALVVGYLVFVPLIVTLPLLVGAAAGLLLQIFGAHGRRTLPQNEKRP